MGIGRDFEDEALLLFLGATVASNSAITLTRGIIVLGSRVSCKPPIGGGGVNGSGVEELSDELRLGSSVGSSSILEGTRFGNKGSP